jgi:hypothetical protein
MPEAQSCPLRFGGNACLGGAVTYVGAVPLKATTFRFAISRTADMGHRTVLIISQSGH